MQSAVKPSKEQVRDYMQQRVRVKAPPPDASEIRRQLGWGLLQQILARDSGSTGR